MDVVFSHTAALAIGKRQTLACVHTPTCHQTCPFSMMTGHLLEMADWFAEHGVTHVAIEPTGSYWKPIYNLLEDGDLHLLLVNPRDYRNVPGRKSDVKDAEWLVDLLRHGLLRPSFIPDRAQRELREVVRYRRKLIEERTREYNRLEKKDPRRGHYQRGRGGQQAHLQERACDALGDRAGGGGSRRAGRSGSGAPEG